MNIYNRAGEPNPTNTGREFGTALSAAELAHRQRYAPPAVPGRQRLPNEVAGGASVGPGAGDIPMDYNLQAGYPVKYSVPTAQKENLATREIVRNAIRESGAGARGGVVRTDPITQEEVDFVKHMKDQAEVADLDRYVNVFFDPRKPGNMPKLMEIYPEYVNRRIQQTKTDYEYALRSQMIDQWGVNTFDDLLFLYWRDQGKISGPTLATERSVDHQYTAGYLSPFYWGLDHRKGGEGLKLPYASAQYGKAPTLTGGNWTLPDADNQPLSQQRGIPQYASALYGNDPSTGTTRAAQGAVPPGI